MLRSDISIEILNRLQLQREHAQATKRDEANQDHENRLPHHERAPPVEQAHRRPFTPGLSRRKWPHQQQCWNANEIAQVHEEDTDRGRGAKHSDDGEVRKQQGAKTRGGRQRR